MVKKGSVQNQRIILLFDFAEAFRKYYSSWYTSLLNIIWMIIKDVDCFHY